MSSDSEESSEDVYDRPKCIEEVFHEAVYNNELEKVKECVSKGVELDWTDPMGWTALHLAARQRNTEIAEFLIKKGADINKAGLNDWTALHYACHSGADDITKLLVENGIDTDLETVDGRVARDMCITWAMKKYLFDRPEYQVEYERWLYPEKFNEEEDARDAKEKAEWEILKQEIEVRREAREQGEDPDAAVEALRERLAKEAEEGTAGVKATAEDAQDQEDEDQVVEIN